MARVISPEEYQRLRALVPEKSDHSMSPGTMRAYLQYHLHLVEDEIRMVLQTLQGQQPSQERDARAQDAFDRERRGARRRAQRDDWLESWTSLNYLLSTREMLRRAIDSISQVS